MYCLLQLSQHLTIRFIIIIPSRCAIFTMCLIFIVIRKNTLANEMGIELLL